MPAARRTADRLPADPTTFVGREHEVDDAVRILGTARLLTVVGVGGVGKTRLALRVATIVGDGTHGDRVDQVSMVDLATVHDSRLVPSAAADALGIRDESSSLTAGDLAGQLADRAVLIVLDNCEHVVDGCAELADALLHGTTTTVVLATSRQPLGVRGEHVLPVRPLVTPPTEDPPNLGALSGSPAVALFVDRARAASPEFTLTPDNAADVTAVCRAVDGLPLGLELAAARMRALSPGQLLERLVHRPAILAGATRTAQPRQHSLEALTEWSFRLCSEREQTMWARMSVFNGGFDLDAAERVCSGGGIDADDVADLVIGLVDKSVLLREERDGHTRYRVLEIIRRYGRERLAASDDHDRVHRSHREHMQRIVDDAAANWFGPDDSAWLDRLRLEHPNLRAALEGCTRSSADAEAGLNLATSFWLMWRAAGWVTEGRRWIDQLVSLAPTRSPLVARALWVDGWLALVQGDHEHAVGLLHRSEDLARDTGDDVARAFVDLFLGQAQTQLGAFDDARRRLLRALEVHRRNGDAAGLALSTFRLAVCHAAAGDADAAVATAETSLQFCRDRGARWWSGYARWIQAVAYWCRDDRAASLEEATESLVIAWVHGDELGAGMALEIVAWAGVDTDPARATRILGVLNARWPRTGSALAGYGNLIEHHRACLDRAHRLLGAERFSDEYARGAAQRIAEIVEELLPDPNPVTSDHPGTLSRRELEVAELVAQGKTNKEIAKALVIAQRTAETHLEHIRTKLRVTSRAQIAAWVVERRAAASTG